MTLLYGVPLFLEEFADSKLSEVNAGSYLRVVTFFSAFLEREDVQ